MQSLNGSEYEFNIYVFRKTASQVSLRQKSGKKGVDTKTLIIDYNCFDKRYSNER